MQPPLVAGLLSEWQISHLFLANNKRFSPVKSVGIVDEMEQNEV